MCFICSRLHSPHGNIHEKLEHRLAHKAMVVLLLRWKVRCRQQTEPSVVRHGYNMLVSKMFNDGQ
jgi:hypothetical protein